MEKRIGGRGRGWGRRGAFGHGRPNLLLLLVWPEDESDATKIYNTSHIFQILTLSLTLSLSLHLCLSVCPSVCLSVPLSHIHTITHTHTNTLSLSLSHTHTHTHCLSLTHTHTHTHTHHKKCIHKNTVCQAIQCKLQGTALGRMTESGKDMHHTGNTEQKAKEQRNG